MTCPASEDSTTIRKSIPLGTPSEKLEFYSERLAKHFPDDKERPPLPEVDREKRDA